MDPQSSAFQPQGDWRSQTELSRVQAVIADHAERLARLERKNEDDSRVKSVWGGASPFPSVLSGTPQQTPLQHPQADHFKNFDDDSNNMIGSLHLDAEEEPRRLGATSRANSVRFDESANQSHWSHAPRSSMDFMSRSGRELGGLPMNDRTPSHRSEGRASSVHSVRSAASGRASSINLDTGFGESSRTIDGPLLAPGLLLLGSVPAIMRCWMTTNFKHDALMYAAVCTGSYKSMIDRRLVEKLNFEDRINTIPDGFQTIMIPVYLPEAVPHSTSSRPIGSTTQVPSLTVTFTIFDTPLDMSDSKALQIILGTDMLRVHSGDVLFSTNSLSIYDDDRNKLSIPLVRPENEGVFNGLRTISGPALPTTPEARMDESTIQQAPLLNGLGQSTRSSADRLSSMTSESARDRWRRSVEMDTEPESVGVGASDHSDFVESRPGSRDGSLRTSLAIGPKPESQDILSDDHTTRETPPRGGSSPAIWSNWRREGSVPAQNAQFDWANANKPKDSPYQRRDTGIKVLRPMKSSNRTLSSTSVASPSPGDGRSRFFDEGKRREELRQDVTPAHEAMTKEGQQSSTSAGAGQKARANPAGGASAFAWLKQGGAK